MSEGTLMLMRASPGRSGFGWKVVDLMFTSSASHLSGVGRRLIDLHLIAPSDVKTIHVLELSM